MPAPVRLKCLAATFLALSSVPVGATPQSSPHHPSNECASEHREQDLLRIAGCSDKIWDQALLEQLESAYFHGLMNGCAFLMDAQPSLQAQPPGCSDENWSALRAQMAHALQLDEARSRIRTSWYGRWIDLPRRPSLSKQALSRASVALSAWRPRLASSGRILSWANSVQDYSTVHYRDWNEWLRSGTPLSGIPDAEAFARLLEKLPDYRGVVYRGVKHLPPGVEQELVSEGTLSDPAFLSATLDEGIARHFAGTRGGFLFVIQSRSGKNISGFSHLAYEREVIFLPGHAFRVTGVRQDPRDPERRVYFLEERDSHTGG